MTALLQESRVWTYAKLLLFGETLVVSKVYSHLLYDLLEAEVFLLLANVLRYLNHVRREMSKHRVVHGLKGLLFDLEASTFIFILLVKAHHLKPLAFHFTV